MSDVERDAEKLAQFQTALLDVLHECSTIEELRERLDKDSAFEPYRDYVRAFDPRMLLTAAELTKKWGMRLD